MYQCIHNVSTATKYRCMGRLSRFWSFILKQIGNLEQFLVLVKQEKLTWQRFMKLGVFYYISYMGYDYYLSFSPPLESSSGSQCQKLDHMFFVIFVAAMSHVIWNAWVDVCSDDFNSYSVVCFFPNFVVNATLNRYMRSDHCSIAAGRYMAIDLYFITKNSK